jgi:hypothetical protein
MAGNAGGIKNSLAFVGVARRRGGYCFRGGRLFRRCRGFGGGGGHSRGFGLTAPATGCDGQRSGKKQQREQGEI